MPRAQIGREICSGVNQFAEVDDAFNVCIFGGLREIARHLQVAFRVDLSALHPVDQIIRNRYALHGFEQVLRARAHRL